MPKPKKPTREASGVQLSFPWIDDATNDTTHDAHPTDTRSAYADPDDAARRKRGNATPQSRDAAQQHIKD